MASLALKSLEEGSNWEHLESINRARHAFRNFVERLNDRLTLVGNSYVEYYRKGRMALILRCELSFPTKFDVKARFLSEDRPFVDKRIAFIVLKAKVGKPHHIEYWEQQLMFVEDVQIVQGPNGAIPSLVGLYDIQEEIDNQRDSGISGETLLFQSAINSTYQLLPLVANWKPCPMVGFSGRDGFKSLVVENIQGAFEIVQGIADDESTARHIESRFVDLKSNAVAPSVFLDADGVKIRLGESLQQLIQVTDVLHGPFNLTS
ncbi:MAG: hypothetical protein WA320_12015 [Candidatus Sulfotelmatobacter sp.]